MTDETDAKDSWIRDGEVWIPDGPALAEKVGALYMYFEEGDLYAGTARGDFLVRDLLAELAEPNVAVVCQFK